MRRWRHLIGGLLAWAGGSATAEEVVQPLVALETSVGTITIELWPAKAPASVANFLQLVDDGFYRGTVFHRVMAGFMIQAGGYDAALNYREAPRQVVNESSNGLRNRRGTLAMARHSDPDSAGSQFYVNMVDNAHLDAVGGKPGYTVFGRVVDGFAVAEEIEFAETGVVAGTPNVPLEAIVILDARRVAPTPEGAP